MRRVNLLALLLSMLCAASAAQAASWYRVEVMLIAYTDEQQMQLENWPLNFNKEIPKPLLDEDAEPAEAIDTEEAEVSEEELEADAEIDITNADAETAEAATDTEEQPDQWWLEPDINHYSALLSNFEFSHIPKASWPVPLKPLDNLLLADALKFLQKRTDMQVIWHQAWVEPIQERQHSIKHPVNIQLETTNFQLELTGTFELSVSRYLHITTDLQMQHKSLEGEDLRAAKIQLNRRMRSGELHYLDHPMLGIMVKVIPIKDELDL